MAINKTLIIALTVMVLMILMIVMITIMRVMMIKMMTGMMVRCYDNYDHNVNDVYHLDSDKDSHSNDIGNIYYDIYDRNIGHGDTAFIILIMVVRVTKMIGVSVVLLLLL